MRLPRPAARPACKAVLNALTVIAPVAWRTTPARAAACGRGVLSNLTLPGPHALTLQSRVCACAVQPANSAWWQPVTRNFDTTSWMDLPTPAMPHAHGCALRGPRLPLRRRYARLVLCSVTVTARYRMMAPPRSLPTLKGWARPAARYTNCPWKQLRRSPHVHTCSSAHAT